MTASEIQLALQRYRARIEAILEPDELAAYDAYQQRVQDRLNEGDPSSIPMSPIEQGIVDKIEHDTQASALNKQFLALIRVEKLPQ
jgi:hypothetical protein